MSHFAVATVLIAASLVGAAGPAAAATLPTGAANAVLFNFDFTSNLTLGLGGSCGQPTCLPYPPPYTSIGISAMYGDQYVHAPVGMVVYDGLNGANYLGTTTSLSAQLPQSLALDGKFSIGFFAINSPVTYDTILATAYGLPVPTAFVYGVLAVPEPATWLLSFSGLVGIAAWTRRATRSTVRI